MNESQREQFIRYFRKRIESLDYCNSTFENTLLDEKQDMVDYVNRGGIQPDDPELNEAFSKIDCLILPTFRNCMLVAVCTLLEETLRRIGTLTVAAFDAQVAKKKTGTKISKYLRVLKDQLSLDYNPVDASINVLDHIVVIRNAIAHAWGKIDNCSNPDKIRDAVSNISWAVITDDDYIYLEDEAYADVVEPVLDIIQHIINVLPNKDSN